MKSKRAIAVLLCALLLPAAPSQASDDIFSIMFRMMLTMMNVMANSMNSNTGFSNWGGNNWGPGSGLGMAGWPLASGFGGMGGWPGMNSWSGMNPWTGMSPWSGMNSWTGMNPWSGYGGVPGTGFSPWSYQGGGNPWGGSWGNPFSGVIGPGQLPGAWNQPYPGLGYGGYPEDYTDTSLLDGRWFGASGDVLEIRGDRFQLMAGAVAISGVVRVDNNILSLYSPDTDTLTQYTFVRNQTELLLQDVTGEVLAYRRYPYGYVF